MKVRSLISRIHLVLGLSSGLVVLIIGLTGAIYCFAPELETLQPYRYVTPEQASFLPPSRMESIATAAMPGKTPQRIYYYRPGKSVMVLFSKKDEYSHSVFINPYNGKVLKVRNNEKDFLSVVLQLHRTLCIPYGQDIVSWGTVIFLCMMVTGLVLWWPRKKQRPGQGFRIMWRASPKRLNYDLHKVLGFYVTWIAIISALSGLMFAFPSFADSVYGITGAARSAIQPKPPVSNPADTTIAAQHTADIAWRNFAGGLGANYAIVMLVFPAANDGALLVRANPSAETLYKSDFRYFDRYTGLEIPGAYVWGRHRDRKTLSDNIRSMNYDIHTGAIFGLPGRIVLFFVALIVSSLPVTGFYFWWGRTNKRSWRYKRRWSMPVY